MRVHGGSLDALFLPGISGCFFGETQVPIQFADPVGVVCIAPFGAVGTVPLNITLNGVDVLNRPGWRYTFYADPWLLSAVPNGGPILGGTSVTLRGYGLLGGVMALALQPRCKFCHATDVDSTGTRCERGTDVEGERLEIDESGVPGEYSTNLSSAPLLPETATGLTVVTALGLEATAAGLEVRTLD